MLPAMGTVFDAFWRAAAYCFMPRLILLSLLPLIVASASAFGLAWFFWEDAVNGVRDLLEGWQLLAPAMHWLDGISGGAFRSVIGPLIVVALSVPVLLITALLLVAVFMGPTIVSLVAQRRFPGLQKRRGAGVWRAVAWGLGSTVVALGALVLSLPFWLFPPAALLLPPLIWGWLTYRVMASDVLGRPCHRRGTPPADGAATACPCWPSVCATGLLGAAPSLVWASGALFAAAFVILIPLAIWIYMLVFAFASLWFAHFALAALAELRAQQAPADEGVIDVPATTRAPSLHASERLASAHDPLEDRHHP